MKISQSFSHEKNAQTKEASLLITPTINNKGENNSAKTKSLSTEGNYKSFALHAYVIQIRKKKLTKMS